MTKTREISDILTGVDIEGTITATGSISSTPQGTLWGTANDGAGSGLDADTVDGIDSSRIPYALNSSLGSTNTFTADGGIGANNITRSMFYRDNGSNFGTIGFHAQHATASTYAWQMASTSYTDASSIQARVKNNGTWTAPVTIWNSGNDGSGSGLNADLLDGYHLSTTRNAPNTVPVRDANGYLNLGWINTTSGVTTNTINKIYASNDDYMRYVTPATLISQLGLITNSTTQPNQLYIRNTSPTIYLRDTDNRSSMIHQNSNIFYVLRGSGNDSVSWAQVNGRWPLQINLENNDATFGGNVTAYSDKRLKENIKPIENSMEMFSKIDAKRFDWIESGKGDIGFIAQDVKAAGLTEVVKEVEDRDPETGELYDTHLTLDYSRMVSVLWDVVKELKAEVEQLKSEK